MEQYCRVCYLHRIHRKASQWSASLLQRLRNAPQRTAVCLFVRIRHPGETAEWIGTRLVMMVGVGLCIGVLDSCGDRRMGRGSFGMGNVWDFPL